MKKTKIKQLTFLLLGLSCGAIHAQQNTTAAGGDATGSGGSVAFSVGQVSYSTLSSTNGTITQGVQQPYEILTVSVKENLNISLKAIAYPIPTSQNLNLKIDDSIEGISWTIFDINGRQLQSETIIKQEAIISLSDYAAASYFLKVYKKGTEVKTFKIIKN